MLFGIGLLFLGCLGVSPRVHGSNADQGQVLESFGGECFDVEGSMVPEGSGVRCCLGLSCCSSCPLTSPRFLGSNADQGQVVESFGGERFDAEGSSGGWATVPTLPGHFSMVAWFQC